MNTASLRPAFHRPAHGATALGTDGPSRPTNPSRTRHQLRRRTSDLLRAIRVFAGAAFGVVILGTSTDPDTGTGTHARTSTDTRTGTGTSTSTRTSTRTVGDEPPYLR